MKLYRLYTVAIRKRMLYKMLLKKEDILKISMLASVPESHFTCRESHEDSLSIF